MGTLRQFVNSHFFSKKANLLYHFFESQNLIFVLELVVNQIYKSPLPELESTAEGVYIPLKQSLKNISDQDNYEEIDDLVREFSLRVMIEYFKRSEITVSDFIQKLSRGMQTGAKNVGVNPKTIDGDMEWDRIRLSLKNLRSPSLEQTLKPLDKSLEKNDVYLIWNEEADLNYLKKVLIIELKIFDTDEMVNRFFDKDAGNVVCEPRHIDFLVYLFRQLCPTKPNNQMPGDRIVSTSNSRTLWKVLSGKLIKPDGRNWTIGALKNCCSKVKNGQDYTDRREEIATIVSRLEKGMNFL